MAGRKNNKSSAKRGAGADSRPGPRTKVNAMSKKMARHFNGAKSLPLTSRSELAARVRPPKLRDLKHLFKAAAAKAGRTKLMH